MGKSRYDAFNSNSNALLLPFVMEYNVDATGDKYRDIAKEEDLQKLAEMSMVDACTPGNPKDQTVEEIKEIYKKAF